MKERQRQLLLELRSELTGKMHTLPFTIYNDEAIEELLRAQPKSVGELAGIKGFPKNGKRVKGFGEAVATIFRDTDRIDRVEVSGTDVSDFKVNVATKEMRCF